MAFYPRIHQEHWLFDKLEDGRLVILEDELDMGGSSLGSGDHHALAANLDNHREEH